MMKWKKVALVTLLSVFGVIILAACGLALMCWNFNRWPFDLTKLDRLSDTTTMQEVEQVLGKPSSAFVRTNQNGKVWHEWAYSAPGAWPIVYIYFDPDGTYSTNECDY